MIDARVRDIGGGFWEEGPYKTWVSKTDVTEYLRCQYRVYLSHKEGRPYSYFKDPGLIASLLQAGIEFEAESVDKTPVEREADIETVAYEDVILRTSELIRNHSLGIQGIVDLVATEKGKLIPIEIKSHKSVTDSDRLELAFYWRLLEPLRIGRPRRKGYVLLNTGDVHEVVLTNKDFTRLDFIISRIRKIRETGLKLSLVKECETCRLKSEHVRRVFRDGGLSGIQNISSSREAILRQLGIKDIFDLAKANAEELWPLWRKVEPCGPSPEEVKRMIYRAQALIEGTPKVIQGSGFPKAEKVIFLDLEYDTGKYIFLLGASVFENGERLALYQEIAEEICQEQTILDALCELLGRSPTCPIMTWSGGAADLPQLRSAWKRHGFPKEVLEDIESRHVDLYRVTQENICLPIYGLKLGEVAKYFRFKRQHPDIISMMMPGKYLQYLEETNETAKAELREEILAHNQDDLESLTCL